MGQFPPFPGSALWPWPHNELGNSLCLKKTFVHHADYGSSFLPALVLYLPGYVPKFCRSGLTLNRRVFFCWFIFLVYSLQLTPSPYPVTRPCTSIVTKICAVRSENTAWPWHASVPSATAGPSCEPKLEVPARSWPGECAWTAEITDTRMPRDMFA